MPNKPDLIVYAVSEYHAGGEARNRWTRVGVAFKNQKNGYNIEWDALPLGRTILLPPKETPPHNGEATYEPPGD